MTERIVEDKAYWPVRVYATWIAPDTFQVVALEPEEPDIMQVPKARMTLSIETGEQVVPLATFDPTLGPLPEVNDVLYLGDFEKWPIAPKDM